MSVSQRESVRGHGHANSNNASTRGYHKLTTPNERRTVTMNRVERAWEMSLLLNGRIQNFLLVLGCLCHLSSMMITAEGFDVEIDRGFISATRPVEPRFQEPLVSIGLNDSAKHQMFSSAHCFSQNHQQYEWKTNSCLFKNLCFDTKAREFVFFARDEHAIPLNVSIGTFNYKWGKQYDKTMNFRPKIFVGESIPPKDYVMASANELWVPFLPFCPANIGHLMWDDYLTIFLLAWAAKPLFFQESFSLRPFWYNPPDDPPWATCDWIRLHEGPGHSLQAGYSDRCLKNNHRWLPLLLGPKNHVLPETSKVKFDSKGKRFVCFPHSAVGITPFANQGSGHHGWNPDDGVAPSFGRAPLIFEFTRHMMRQVGTDDVPRNSLEEIVVFFSSRSSDRVALDFSSHVNALSKEIPAMEASIAKLLGHDRLKVVIKHEVLFEKTARAQIDLAASACVYVTAAGGGAFTAQFLPRGSSIILYESHAGEHLHKGKVDWKVFNAITWIRSTFLDIDEAHDVQKLTELVRKDVINCISFMEALKK